MSALTTWGGTPGALVGPLTTSLVRFSAPRYSSISGTAVRVQGLVDPRVVVDHVTLRTRKFGLSVDVRPSFAGAFSYTMTWNTVDDVEDMLEAEAFDAAGRSLGYDLVPLMIVGSASDPDGDGIPTGEDKCDGVYDPMQIDLNDGTPGAYLCEPGTDTDGDGLAKEEERTAGTSSALSDTDGDGVPDGDEVDAYARTPFEGMLDPTSDDSDGDGESDGTEMRSGDPNGDGIPDVIDPLDGTVGLDPADTLFLVEETWDTQFAANLPGHTDSPDVNVAATVQFTLNYVLVVRGGNWLSGDTPLPTGHLGTDASVLGRVVRLDSFGLPFMTDVRVETTRCTSTGGAIAQECDFVPVIGSCDGTTGTGDDDDFCWETYRTLRPEGVDRDRSAFVIDDYPLAGFDRAAGGQIIGPVRFGMGPISRSFGGAAYYGGIAPDGRDDRRSNPGLYLNVASLHLDGERTARSVEGLSLLLCRRSEGGTAATTSAGENGRCDPVSVEGNLQMHAEGGIFLDFFGGLTSRDGVVPASYGLCNDDLIDLIRGNTTEVSDYQRHGDSSRRSSGPCGQTIISRNSPGPNLGGAPLSIIDRRIDYVVRRLGLQFEDGPARDASMDYRIPSGIGSNYGTDRLWDGHIGYRAYAAGDASRNAADVASNDWLRVNVGLARSSNSRARNQLRRILERCREASPPAGCRPHLRLQVRNHTGGVSGLQAATALGPDDAVLLSQPVDLDVLAHDGSTRGGVVLRWTGQPDTWSAANRLADGAHFGRITCRPFFVPASEAARALPTSAFPSATVHPGLYDLAGQLVRGDPGTLSVDCSGSATVPPVSIPGVLPHARSAVSIGYPIAVRDWSPSFDGTFTRVYGVPRPGPVKQIMLDELRVFYQDAGAWVDVFHSPGSGFAYDAEALPPYGALHLTYGSAEAAMCQTGMAGDVAIGRVDAAALDYERPAVAFACVDMERTMTDNATTGVCEGTWSRTSWGTSECMYQRHILEPTVEWNPYPSLGHLDDVQLLSRTMALHPLHETGHLLGLNHVLLGGYHAAGGVPLLEFHDQYLDRCDHSFLPSPAIERRTTSDCSLGSTTRELSLAPHIYYRGANGAPNPMVGEPTFTGDGSCAVPSAIVGHLPLLPSGRQYYRRVIGIASPPMSREDFLAETPDSIGGRVACTGGFPTARRGERVPVLRYLAAQYPLRFRPH